MAALVLVSPWLKSKKNCAGQLRKSWGKAVLCLTADANFSTSRYNFLVPTKKGCLLYNSFSGAVLLLGGPDSAGVSRLLAAQPRAIDIEAFPDELLADLVAGSFLVPTNVDQLQGVRDRFWEARRETPLALTLTTTLDCNLGCYYCYEDRSEARLDATSAEDIASWARSKLLASGKKTLHVDWYGGEPLLNPEFIETASGLLQQLCRELEVVYSASIISNGTCWPEDVGAFIQRHKIRQAQISFDGMRHHHDLRRRFRDKTRSYVIIRSCRRARGSALGFRSCRCSHQHRP